MDALVQLFSEFGVEWNLLIGQLVMFAVLFVALRLILYKPVLKMLEERKQRIAQGLKDAETAAKERRESEQQSLERLKEATAKAELLLEQANKSAQQIKDDMLAQSQAEIVRNRQVQQDMLGQMKADMLREVKAEVAGLVVSTTEKVLRQQLDSKQQQQFADAAAKELK